MANHMTIDDSGAGEWGARMLAECIHDAPGERMWVDVNLLASMCASEPKYAQTVMQLFAAELRKELDGAPMREAKGNAASLRLIVGSLWYAYCLGQFGRGAIREGELPPELVGPMQLYPEINEAANVVGQDWQRSGRA